MQMLGSDPPARPILHSLQRVDRLSGQERVMRFACTGRFDLVDVSGDDYEAAYLMLRRHANILGQVGWHEKCYGAWFWANAAVSLVGLPPPCQA